MSLEGFWVDYGIEGMHARYGGDPQLALDMEVFGIGMDVDGEWAQGGPVVWRRRNGTLVIGWIQALSRRAIGRSGAVRAWGVQAHGEEKNVLYWPWHWETLRSEPSEERLNELVEGLGSPPRRSVPPKLSDEFAGLLSEAYRLRARGETSTLHIPLEVKGELPALAWFWLLGPEDPLKATLGPPRHEPAAVKPDLTYAGQLGARRPQFRVSDWIWKRMFLPMRQGNNQNAILAAKELRGMPVETQLTLLDPPAETPSRGKTAAAFGMKEISEEPAGIAQESESTSSSPLMITEWRDWAILGLAIVNTVLLLAITWILSRPPSPQALTATKEPGALTLTAPITATTDAASTATAVSTQPTTTADELRPEVVGVALHSALKKSRTGVTYSGQIATWLADTTPATTRSDVARARTAAVQLYFFKNGCGAGTIDGAIGPAFWDSIHCLARTNDPFDVLKSDQSLIAWLQSQ